MVNEKKAKKPYSMQGIFMQSFIYGLVAVVFSIFTFSPLPAVGQREDSFRFIRDLYLSDDIGYGEVEVTLQLLVGLANRDDLQLSNEFRQAVASYEFEASEFDSKVLFSDGMRRKQLEKLRKDFKLRCREKLLLLVNKDVLLQQIQCKNLEFLKEWGEDYRLLDPTFLTNRFLTKRLKLSKKQTEELDAKHRRVSELQKQLWGEFGDAYYSMANRALEEVNDILDPKQRRQFETLVGTPVNWSRMFESNRQFEYVFRVSDPNSNHKSVNLRRGPISNTEELKDLPEVDVFLYQLLSTPFLREELDLTDDQEKTLIKILDDYRHHRVVDEANSVPRFDLLLNAESTVPDEVAELLLHHQLEILQKVELQLRTGAYRSSFGLLHPKMAAKLGLSKNQMSKIQTASERFNAEVDAFASETKIQFKKLLRQNYLDTMPLLNSDQLRHYSLLTGLDTSNFQSK